MRHTILGLMLALVVAACGSGAAPPGPLAADALPGQAGEIVELDASTLAGDAIDFEALESLLDDAGFAGGTQRMFAETQGARQRRALARVLAFDAADGADAYLGWLEDHVDEVIGTADLVEPPDLPGVAFLALSDSDCCPKATAIYLVAWRKGSTVLTLELGGDAIDEDLVAELATALDAEVAG